MNSLALALFAAVAFRGVPGPEICLTADNTVVVAARTASPVSKFAAAELRTFLGETLGGEIAFSESIPDDPEKLAIVIGAGPSNEVAALERDAYVIRSSGRRIDIFGRDSSWRDPVVQLKKVGGTNSHYYERGTLFGVYGFLERHAGCRFYFPGRIGTVVQRAGKLAIRPGEEKSAPDFTRRSVLAWYDGYWFEGPEVKKTGPGKVLNTYRLRLETEQVPCCHGSRKFGYLKRFGASNPEYFSMRQDGTRDVNPNGRFPCQLCWSSAIVDRMYEDSKAYLEGKVPDWGGNCVGRKYVDIMPQDGFFPCRCGSCQAAFRKGDRNYATELVWGKVAEIAGRLKRDGTDGKICMMAYVPYQRIPDFDLPDNIDVMVSAPGPWSKGNPARDLKDDEMVKAWAKKTGGKVWLWSYPNKFPGAPLEMKGIPQMTPHAYGEYFKRIAPWVHGAFVESESDRFIYNYLNYYVFARVAWDLDTDVNSLLDEHHRLMFGAGAEDMKAVYDTLERKWIYEIAGRVVDTPLGPTVVPPPEYVLWNEVYSESVLAGLEKRFADAVGKVRPGSLERERIDFFRREFLDRLVQARNGSKARIDAAQSLEHVMDGFNGPALELVPFKRKEGSSAELIATKVKVWKTDLHLCARFDCREPYPDRICSMKREKDDPDMWKDDSVEVFINPSGDRRNYIQILVNSDGVVCDQKSVSLGSLSAGADYSWDSHALVRVHRAHKLWGATISIPLSRLGRLADRIPANFCRNRALSGTSGHHVHYQWSPFAERFADIEHWGVLVSKPK